jgi:hypothetical protein
MLADAIAEIKAEMDGNKNNSYIQVVGAFLLRHLETNPQDAEKILTKGKTIGKSLDAMREEARKKQHNGVAMLTDAEGFAIVLKYFGIEGEPAVVPATPAAPVAPAATTPSATSDFNVTLDDFLM